MSKKYTGYANRFENRPEFALFGALISRVIEATSIPERTTADGLKIVRIKDIFADGEEIFIGFGKPNAYLVVPDGKGGYQKFAGKSLKRAPSRIEDTRGWVQSGILVRLTNLPEGTTEKVRQAMLTHDNVKFWTCVNAISNVLHTAGFHSSDKALTERYFPYHLMNSLMQHGLEFAGQKVGFEVIRTSSEPLQRYAAQVVIAELSTICRHGDRALQAKAKKSKVIAACYTLLKKPFSLLKSKDGNRKPGKIPVAPALQDELPYKTDLTIRVAKASLIASLLRQLWGSHALFELVQQRVNPADHLPDILPAFPQANPNLFTRVKKRLLFSPLVIKFIRGLLVSDYVTLEGVSEMDVYDMLRTHSDKASNIYNLVITDDSIIVARISVWRKLVDWILSKHVLVSGYHPKVRYASEAWKDEDGFIHVNMNSGTYQPTKLQQARAVAYVQEVLPNLFIAME